MLTDEAKQRIVQAAAQALDKAYAPYSHYPVGAALITQEGKIYTGVNVENAAYPSSMCAERVAVFKAVSEGEYDFNGIAVVTPNGGSPCGSCRQVLSEFNLDMEVIIADDHGNIHTETTVRGLLPGSFGPIDLEKSKQPKA